jgi:hypothetical protein
MVPVQQRCRRSLCSWAGVRVRANARRCRSAARLPLWRGGSAAGSVSQRACSPIPCTSTSPIIPVVSLEIAPPPPRGSQHALQKPGPLRSGVQPPTSATCSRLPPPHPWRHDVEEEQTSWQPQQGRAARQDDRHRALTTHPGEEGQLPRMEPDLQERKDDRHGAQPRMLDFPFVPPSPTCSGVPAFHDDMSVWVTRVVRALGSGRLPGRPFPSGARAGCPRTERPFWRLRLASPRGAG